MKNDYDYDYSIFDGSSLISQNKVQITIRIDKDVIFYFKNLAPSTGLTYQNLINLYLRDCMKKNLRPNVSWIED